MRPQDLQSPLLYRDPSRRSTRNIEGGISYRRVGERIETVFDWLYSVRVMWFVYGSDQRFTDLTIQRT